MWKKHEVRKKLEDLKDKFNFKLPQMQTLLCQERFLLRLYSLKEGSCYIWKGGSLLVRRYQPNNQKPRWTVDIDLEAQKIGISKTEEIFKKAMSINLKDGFNFLEIKKEGMKRDAPYGGERYTMQWSLFDSQQSEVLKIDVCSGDSVEPDTVRAKDLCLINPIDEISFQVYPPEFIFAEKLETIARFKTGNTRLKDFIDLYTLIKNGLNFEKLKKAVNECFTCRKRKFQSNELLKILTDVDFVTFLKTKYSKEEHEQLNLPKIEILLETIRNQVKSLDS